MTSSQRPHPARRQELINAIATHPLRDLPDIRGLAERVDTGVLVPLQLEPEPVVTMIVRAQGLRHHPNEVAFPGGKPDPSDTDLTSTALREAQEEIGLHPSDVEIVGRLSAVPVATSRYKIHPFVGLVSPTHAPWRASGELARVLDLRLQALTDGTHEHCAMSVAWGGQSYQVPVFVLDPETRLYGASAIALLELLTVVLPFFGMTLPPPRSLG